MAVPPCHASQLASLCEILITFIYFYKNPPESRFHPVRCGIPFTVRRQLQTESLLNNKNITKEIVPFIFAVKPNQRTSKLTCFRRTFAIKGNSKCPKFRSKHETRIKNIFQNNVYLYFITAFSRRSLYNYTHCHRIQTIILTYLISKLTLFQK